MKTLVTGGSGYFGSHLIKKLLDRGYEVRSLDINDADDRPSKAEFIKADIRDFEAVKRACEGVDFVFHTVAQVPLANDPDLFLSVNLGGTETLLKASLESRIKAVVHVSTSAVFSVPIDMPITDDTPVNPMEPYGKAKLQGEKLCFEYANKGLNISVVRPRTIIGGESRLGIFQILFEWVSEGKKIPVFDKGDYLYQFVHSDDLAEVCIRSAEKSPKTDQKTPRIYNCGAEKYATMREMLQTLCDHAATGAKVRSVPMKPAMLAMKIANRLGLSPLTDWHWLAYGHPFYFDTSKIRKELGYTAKYSNDEMICESYDWYIANKDKLKVMGQGASAHRSAVKQGILKLVKWLS
ncbi:MAG: NAD-dependent epimerase/dehydratase family protein [Helicobacteraceae bacterium]|jgi:nucleoside-diphosphate-sugar epimerase|nr:NAD-dependent epimerase/dehydratase family protein [Helicobacteraceae bacterium]